MYKAKLSEWNMGKNATRQDWLAFAKLYQGGRAAGSPQVFVQIHNKVRRIEDLRRYLKSHKEEEQTFFIEAMDANVVIPEHINRCTADGSGCMALSGAELDVGMSASTLPGPSTPASRPPPVADYEFDAAELVETHLTTATEGTWISPLTSTNSIALTNQQVDPSLFTTFKELSELGSFHQLLEGDKCDLQDNMGNDLSMGKEPLSGSSTVRMLESLATPQLCDVSFSYTLACMMACMLGAAGRNDMMKQHLRQATVSFRQMCLPKSSFLLIAASMMLTWLLVHAEGKLSENIMRTSLLVAQDALGIGDPVTVLLEWMTAAAGGNKLRSCAIDSAILLQLWEGFRRTLGEDHGHAIVAMYCLSFQLMFADKDFAQAEQHLAHLWTISASTFGSSHVQTINILATLSRAQSRQKKFLSALYTINMSLVAAPLGLNHPHRLELLVRKAVVLRKLERLDETEGLYWIVVKGRVATLGLHHKATMAAHESLVDVMKENGTWEAKKGEAHKLLGDSQVSVLDHESWWRQVIEAHRIDKLHDRASSDEDD